MSDDAFFPRLAGSILNVIQYVIIINLRDVAKLSETPRVIFKRILFLRVCICIRLWNFSTCVVDNDNVIALNIRLLAMVRYQSDSN